MNRKQYTAHNRRAYGKRFSGSSSAVGELGSRMMELAHVGDTTTDSLAHRQSGKVRVLVKDGKCTTCGERVASCTCKRA